MSGVNLKATISIFCMCALIAAQTLALYAKNSIDKNKQSRFSTSTPKHKTPKPKKENETNLPPIYLPNSYYDYLKKDLPSKRLLIEKYFLLIQKQKLERLKNSSPQIQKFKKIIRRQLKIIERRLNRKVNSGIIQHIA
ncbi:MAG: hypothetical protein ACE5IW_03025 [bacterium]